VPQATMCRNLYYAASCFFLSVSDRYSKSGKILESERDVKTNEMWIERIGIKNVGGQFDPINSLIGVLVWLLCAAGKKKDFGLGVVGRRFVVSLRCGRRTFRSAFWTECNFATAAPKKRPNGVRRLLWSTPNGSSLLSRSGQLYKYQIVFLCA
jgi:hypothetical protein